MTPGPMNFRGPIRGLMVFRGPMGLKGFIGPIEMKHRRPFFFLRSPEFGQENRFNFGEDLFFWRSLENPEKSVPFFLLVLDCTKPEMRNICAVPRPTLGSRRPWVRTDRIRKLLYSRSQRWSQ